MLLCSTDFSVSIIGNKIKIKCHLQDFTSKRMERTK
jgi:hypothetical protein